MCCHCHKKDKNVAILQCAGSEAEQWCRHLFELVLYPMKSSTITASDHHSMIDDSKLYECHHCHGEVCVCGCGGCCFGAFGCVAEGSPSRTRRHSFIASLGSKCSLCFPNSPSTVTISLWEMSVSPQLFFQKRSHSGHDQCLLLHLVSNIVFNQSLSFFHGVCRHLQSVQGWYGSFFRFGTFQSVLDFAMFLCFFACTIFISARQHFSILKADGVESSKFCVAFLRIGFCSSSLAPCWKIRPQ